MTYRVIVVDDEPDYCIWVRKLLDRSEDFKVVAEACSGEEGIRLINQLVPDVMLLDVCVPGPDGFEVARYARDHFPAIKSVVISAQEEAIYHQLATQNGAQAFISKANLSLPALRNAIQRET